MQLHITPASTQSPSEPKPARPGTAAVQITPAPYVTVDLAAYITGFTEKAIRRKIQDGVWLEGREYRKSPDGRILISLKGYTSWVEQGQRKA